MGQLNYTWNKRQWRGHDHYQCVDCAFDTLGLFGEAKIRAHCVQKKHGIDTAMQGTIAEYIESQRLTGPKSVIITLGYLCWNTKDISVEGVLALVQEAERLIALGNFPMICVVDNGSTDGTAEAIVEALGGPERLPDYFFLTGFSANKGISAARNLILDFSRVQESKYTLLMDGDIEVVPLSVYTMMRYLECHSDVGVIGAYSSNCSNKRSDCATSLVEIPESRVHHDIRCAWTQYGLFRSSLFVDGVRFDESGPFGKPGWGFEDDDLHYQIVAREFKNRYFGGMCYLHRALHSSWAELEAQGINLPVMFKSRKDYLVQKWRKLGVEAGILKLVEGQKLPGARG